MYNRISASISFIILRQIKYRRIFWEGWCLQKLDDFNLNMKTKRVPKIKLFCLLKIPLVTNKLFPVIPAFYAHVGLCQILFTSEFTCDFFQRSFKQSLNSCFVLRRRTLSEWPVATSRLHMHLRHFDAFWKKPTSVVVSKVRCCKMQNNLVNACLNRMWQLGLNVDDEAM